MCNGDKHLCAEALGRVTDNLKTGVRTELAQPFCLRDPFPPLSLSSILLDSYFQTTYSVLGTRGKSKAERTKCLPSRGSWSGRESRQHMRHLDNMPFKRLKGHRGGRRCSQGLYGWRATKTSSRESRAGSHGTIAQLSLTLLVADSCVVTTDSDHTEGIIRASTGVQHGRRCQR